MKLHNISLTSICIKTFILLTFFAILLGACDSMETDWKKTKKQNTIEAYDTFIADHPESKYLQDALDMKSMLLPNIVFKQIDKKSYSVSYDVYGTPEKMETKSGILLAEFIDDSSWIKGMNAYFYLENKGATGEVPITILCSDDMGSEGKFNKNFTFIDSTSYKVKVNIVFVHNASVQASSSLSPLNTITLVLPDGEKDTFSVRIPSWNGIISDIIEIAEI